MKEGTNNGDGAKGRTINHILLSLPLVCLMFIGSWRMPEKSTRSARFSAVSRRVSNTTPGAESGHSIRRAGDCRKIFSSTLNKKMIQPDKDSLVRQRTRIRWVGRVENRMVLMGASEGVEGVDDGVAWSMSLSRSDGQFVITASGDRVGFVAFGTCRVD